MRKATCLCAVLALAILWVGCGDGTHTVPLTSQVAFLRDSSSGSSARALTQHRIIEQGSLNRRALTHLRSRAAGLKPYTTGIASGPISILMMKLDGTGQTIVSEQGGWFEAVQLSLDGTKGVVAAEDTNGYLQIFVADTTNPQKSNPVQITSDSADHWDPQISPDNKTVIFVKYDSASDLDQMFTVSTSGGAQKMISTPSFDVSYPTYTPGGKQIVFEQEDLDTINIMDLNGANIQTLTNGDGTSYYDECPSVSPDGTKLIFSRYGKNVDTGGSDVYIANLDGTGVTALTTNGDSWDPLFVKNKILFVQDVYDQTLKTWHQNIFSMNYDGSSQVNLTNSATDDTFLW